MKEVLIGNSKHNGSMNTHATCSTMRPSPIVCFLVWEVKRMSIGVQLLRLSWKNRQRIEI